MNKMLLVNASFILLLMTAPGCRESRPSGPPPVPLTVSEPAATEAGEAATPPDPGNYLLLNLGSVELPVPRGASLKAVADSGIIITTENWRLYCTDVYAGQKDQGKYGELVLATYRSPESSAGHYRKLFGDARPRLIEGTSVHGLIYALNGRKILEVHSNHAASGVHGGFLLQQELGPGGVEVSDQLLMDIALLTRFSHGKNLSKEELYKVLDTPLNRRP